MPPKRASLNLPKKTEETPKPEKQEKDKAIGIKKVIFRIPTTAKKQLDRLAFDEETTKQKLFNEAFNDLFKKYGKPEII